MSDADAQRLSDLGDSNGTVAAGLSADAVAQNATLITLEG